MTLIGDVLEISVDEVSDADVTLTISRTTCRHPLSCNCPSSSLAHHMRACHATQLAKLSTVTGKSTEEIAARAWRRLTPNHIHLNDQVRDIEAWVPSSEYSDATVNPLALATTRLLAKINGGHSESLKRFAAVYAGVEPSKVCAAQMFSTIVQVQAQKW